MKEENMLWPILVGLAAVALIIFLWIKNRRDKKGLNEKVTDQMNQTKSDQHGDRDRI